MNLRFPVDPQPKVPMPTVRLHAFKPGGVFKLSSSPHGGGLLFVVARDTTAAAAAKSKRNFQFFVTASSVFTPESRGRIYLQINDNNWKSPTHSLNCFPNHAINILLGSIVSGVWDSTPRVDPSSESIMRRLIWSSIKCGHPFLDFRTRKFYWQ